MKTHCISSKKSVFCLGSLCALLLAAGCVFPMFGSKSTATSESPGIAITGSSAKYVTGSPMLWMDGSNFVYVEGGEFVMGADLAGGGDITPAHTVNLQGFWIQQTEVTNRMYAQCVEQEICKKPIREDKAPYWYSDAQHADSPVVGLNWSNAMDYCTWIQATLPTEAQWEKAARGIEKLIYPWGNTDPTCNLLNYKGCLNPAQVNRVFSYPAGVSPYNAADMSGNIFEWVSDWYAADFYSVSPAADPAGPATGTKRVTRSSSFNSQGNALVTTLRTPLEPTAHSAELGFRCVLTGKDIQGFLPPCTAGSIIPAAVAPEAPSESLEDIKVRSAYCESEGVGRVNFYFSEWEGSGIVEAFDISATGGDIICTNGPGSQSIVCYGSALIPGTYVAVTMCPKITSSPLITPVCPTGYSLDPADGLCHFDLEIVGAGPDSCTAEERWYEGYGCLPMLGDPAAPCPPGYAQMVFEDGSAPLCVPATTGSVPDTCLMGTLVPELNCCQIPASATPACPVGWTYHPITHHCHEDAPSDECQTLNFYVGACPTTPPPQTSCQPQTCSDPKNYGWCQSLCACIPWLGYSCP
jgi:formylglycine-generating enzyme required for sulfatase activity